MSRQTICGSCLQSSCLPFDIQFAAAVSFMFCSSPSGVQVAATVGLHFSRCISRQAAKDLPDVCMILMDFLWDLQSHFCCVHRAAEGQVDAGLIMTRQALIAVSVWQSPKTRGVIHVWNDGGKVVMDTREGTGDSLDIRPTKSFY